MRQTTRLVWSYDILKHFVFIVSYMMRTEHPIYMDEGVKKVDKVNNAT